MIQESTEDKKPNIERKTRKPRQTPKERETIKTLEDGMKGLTQRNLDLEDALEKKTKLISELSETNTRLNKRLSDALQEINLLDRQLQNRGSVIDGFSRAIQGMQTDSDLSEVRESRFGSREASPDQSR